MKQKRTFLFAGGGTGGHVIPALAVAREVCARGHDAFFIGTRHGMEAKLVPAAGFPIEWVEVGALNRVGMLTRLRTAVQLPVAILRVLRRMRERRPAAVFSMGGFAAGPVVLAALAARVPVVVMEPNAIPGFTNRRIAGSVARALVSFPETARYFPQGRTEVTGLPVRQEFFDIVPKPAGETLTVLITGGSRGSRTLNRASRESWQRFAEAGRPVRIVHQAGKADAAELRAAFAATGLEGAVSEFIEDMPRAFAEADVIVCRSGAGTVSELAAAGRAAILVPFPFAADDHQLRNAQSLVAAGAARLVEDREMTGERLFTEVMGLAAQPEAVAAMGSAVRCFARPGAAARAADILEQQAGVRSSA